MEHGILILLLSALVVFVWRARQKRSAKHKAASHSAAVHLQHVYLFQGGQLSESQVESARVRIEKQLNARRQESVFAEMKPTTDFAMQVQALAQIGTRSAVEILEKQLRCSITSNPQEQAWYWLDITRALRQLNWDESLPLLFDCVVESPAPLNQFLAAETVCFPNFISFLQNGDLKSRRASARLLHLALQGLRSGVQPHVVVSGRMGEAVAALWESHWEEVDPVAVRIIQEALRLLQRAGHLERLLGEELWERYQEQIQQIDLLAESFTDWLREARLVLPEQLIRAGTDEQSELLRAAIDLRADTASFVRPMLEVNQMRAPELAVASLAFTKQDGIGEWLCRWVSECGNRRNWKLWRKTAKRGGPVYLTVLRTLRHFPCHEAEQLLVKATSNRDQCVRTAAMSSLGWWEPVDHGAVLRSLHEGRFARSQAVQTAAQAALARLGERQALQWFRRQLAAESTDRVHHVLDRIAQEGIVLLWPDLDHLADAEDGDVAQHACESLEMLREDFILSC